MVEARENQESIIGSAPWAVIEEISRVNPQIDTFNFCTVEFRGDNPDPSLHIGHEAYVQISKSRPASLMSTFAGTHIFLELLKESGGLSFLRKRLRGTKFESIFPEMESFIVSQREKNNLALISVVKMDDGSYKHIPMIDFSSKIDHDIAKAKEGLRKIGENRGFILDSGRGLHYYGLDLLSEEEWPKFIGRCLLLNKGDVKITDDRYLGHRLIDGYGTLRISANSKKPFLPRVVETFNNPQASGTNQEEDDFAFLPTKRTTERSLFMFE